MEESPRLASIEPLMVAARLRALRESLGLNKADFAEAIGIDPSSYTKIEKGEKPLLPPKAYRIWELYAVDMNYVYLGQVGGVPAHLSKKLMKNLNGPQA